MKQKETIFEPIFEHIKAAKAAFLAKRIIFLFLFALMVLIGSRINFSPLIGAENQFFTLFQFFGPIAGMFLGPIFGAGAVLISQIADYLIAGKAWTLINIIRLTPMLFAAYYFGTRRKEALTFIIPILAIAAFILHPIGRQVWFFTLFWTIPLIIRALPEKYANNIGLKSIGSTFTAHAVGGAAWVWAVPMTAEQWVLLIPVVAFERLLFSAGITASYFGLNAVLDTIIKQFRLSIPANVLFIDKKYILSRLRIFASKN